MIRKLNMILLLAAVISSTCMGQLSVPHLSPPAFVKQTVGLTNIEIEYSRPSARGRKVFGADGLVPYGDIWRAGANAATKITFSDDLTIGGQMLRKGSYAILTKPEVKSWILEFYKYESENWNSYVPLQPLAVANAESRKVANSMETFTIGIDDITLKSANLVLSWENLEVMVPIEVEVDKRVMASIEKVMEGPSSNDYFQAALFMHERGIDLEKALNYIQKVTNSDKALFFQVHREALILSDLGKKKEAISAAQRSLELSEKAGNKDFVRLNERLIKTLSGR